MNNRKKQSTLTGYVVMAWMLVLLISNLCIGVLSFTLYRNQLFDARAQDAQNVALAMAESIDGDRFAEIMQTLERDDYWHQVKDYADNIAVVFNTAFIYILDSNYTDEVTYFAEGTQGVADFDLGTSEKIEGIYADEMFDTLKTGKPSTTEPYPSGEYGDMVSGFAAVTNRAGGVVGVVGVDFYFDDVVSQLSSFAITMAVIAAAFLIFCYFFMTYMGNKLAGKPLSNLDEAARRMSAGDMDIQLGIRSQTEIGRLAASFAHMIEAINAQVDALGKLSQGDLTMYVKPRGDRDIMGHAIAQILDKLNQIFDEISRSAAQVSDGARQITDSAQSLAHGTTEQAGAVDKLSSAIGDVASQAEQSLAIASKTNKLTNAIKSDAQIGSEQMNRMTIAVKDISDASLTIGKVIKVIDDIAFQTNILALNASVEAARAGLHGKGFSVVAEEVRNLASKSAEAAKDTERLISDSTEKARLGAAIVDETAASLDRIISGVNECATLVNSITGSFEEQIVSMRQIDEGITQVSRVVQQNSAAAEESAAASEEMSSQSIVLEELVSQFRLRNQDAGRTRFAAAPANTRSLPSEGGNNAALHNLPFTAGHNNAGLRR